MNWNNITSDEDLDQLISESSSSKVLIFKHSTRCSVSMFAKRNLETFWKFNDSEVKPYFLDLIQFRSISNRIATELNVEHESPQIIILENEKVIHFDSHSRISVDNISRFV